MLMTPKKVKSFRNKVALVCSLNFSTISNDSISECTSFTNVLSQFYKLIIIHHRIHGIIAEPSVLQGQHRDIIVLRNITCCSSCCLTMDEGRTLVSRALLSAQRMFSNTRSLFKGKFPEKLSILCFPSGKGKMEDVTF